MLVIEDRLFPEGTIPEFTRPEWYAERDSAPHVDQDTHRPRLDVAAKYVLDYWQPHHTVSDLGAGDGGLLWLLRNHVPAHQKWGYDLQQTNVDAAASRDQDVRFGDVLTGDIDYGDIAVATEMIEHLIDPHGFVADLATKVDFLVASSPVTETAEHHYEYHTWAWDMDGYARMLNSNGFRVLRHETITVFQVAVCVSTLRGG